MTIYRAENTIIYAFGEIIKSAFRFQFGQKFEYYIRQNQSYFGIRMSC